MELQFRQCSPTDLDRLEALETASYPEDEAATRHKLELRLTQAAPYFRCATVLQARPGALAAALPHTNSAHDGQELIVGFVCGTLAVGQTLTHSSMSQHQPEGSTLCIHSVVVDEQFRRDRVGTRMLRDYMHHVTAHQPHVKLVLLLCKANLKSFYASCGFEEVGESDVVHGKEKWFEMRHSPKRL